MEAPAASVAAASVQAATFVSYGPAAAAARTAGAAVEALMTAVAVGCVAAAGTLCWLQLLLLWARILQLRLMLLRLAVPAPPVRCLPAALTALRVPFL